MKTTAIRLEGLLVEDSSALPSCDPIPDGLLFVRRLMYTDVAIGRTLFVTSAPEQITDETIRRWLLNNSVPSTEVVRLTDTSEWSEEDQLLSAAGARSTVLGLYVVAHPYEVEYMTAHGVPVVVFAHADPVIDYRPERGLTWSTLGRSEEADG